MNDLTELIMDLARRVALLEKKQGDHDEARPISGLELMHRSFVARIREEEEE